MSILLNHLCAGVFPKIGKQPIEGKSFHDWLEEGHFSIEVGKHPGGVKLARISVDQIAPYVGFDYQRFALSCFESYSIANAERLNKNIMGWPLLKLYYSSFFGAHSIMRSRGTGVSRIGAKATNRLKEIADIYSLPVANLQPGTYLFQIAQEPSSPKECFVELSPTASGQGVHDSFWTMFCEFLDLEANKAIEQKMPDASDVFRESAKLVDYIKTGGNSRGAWISSIRNDINYRHLYETWLPTRKQAECSLAFKNIPTLRTANLNTSKNSHPIKAFINANIYIVGLSVSVGDTVARTTKKDEGFGKRWVRIKETLA